MIGVVEGISRAIGRTCCDGKVVKLDTKGSEADDVEGGSGKDVTN